MKKLLPTVIAVVAMVLVGLFFAVARLDPEALGQLAIRRVNQLDGVEMSAESFHLGLFSGLELVDAKARIESESGVLRVDVERAVLEHELWPLLRGRVVVRELQLESPHIEQVSKAPAGGGRTASRSGGRSPRRPPDEATGEEPTEPPSDRPGRAGAGLDVDIELVRITDGSVRMRTDDPAAGELAIDGLDLELRDIRLESAIDDLLLALETSGTLSADEIQAGPLHLNDARGNVSLSEGKATLAAVDLRALNGSLKVDSLTADLAQDPFPYDLKLAGTVDVNSLLGRAGKGFGPAHLDLAASGRGPDPQALRGEGALALDAGVLPAVDLITKIEKIVGKSILTGKRYEASDLVFSIADNRLDFQPFTLAAESLRLGAEGTLDLAGPVSLAVSLGAPRADLRVESVPDELVAALTDDDGITRLWFQVTGSLEQPDVALDRGRLEAAAADKVRSEVRRRLGEEAGKLTDRLLQKFGRRSDDEEQP